VFTAIIFDRNERVNPLLHGCRSKFNLGWKRTDIHKVHNIMTYLPFTKVLKRTKSMHTAFHGPHPLWMRFSQVVRASDCQCRSRILVSIPASSYSVESEGWQMQCTVHFYLFRSYIGTDIGTLISLAKLFLGYQLSRKISGVAKTEGGVAKYGLRFNKVFFFDARQVRGLC
jgi:hypothetical protein